MLVWFTALLPMVFALQWRCGPKQLPRPPGPARLPFGLGNLLQLPRKHHGNYFAKLVERYGGLVSLAVGPLNMLMIGDHEAAHELLEVRSANTSSRTKPNYVRDYIDPDGALWGLSSDKQTVNLARRLSAQSMSAVRNGRTQRLLQYESLLLAHQLLDAPSAWMKHIERLVISQGMTLAFGVSLPTGGEPSFHLAREITHALMAEIQLNASIMNFVPVLNCLPVPKPWRRRAANFRLTLSNFLREVNTDTESQTAPAQTWTRIFAEAPDGPHMLFQLVVGALETVSIALQNFVLACVMHGGEHVAAAQRAIDDVVGERLPTLNDRSQLPCVEAFVREVLRWRPPVAAGIPHVSDKDDVVTYRGAQYFVPGGTLIVPVASAIEHDANHHTDPESFDPRRFLDDQGQLLPGYRTSVFGFGKRVCPGIPLAERTLWINICAMLALFNFHSVPGFDYRDDTSAYTGDATERLHPFPVCFKPRDAKRAHIIRQAYEARPKDPFQLF